uniref:Elongation factor EFG domain-containing protein n=1 Tax=Hanusia phi TaxID=3032 RepID=A0A7S0NB98_9CRYP
MKVEINVPDEFQGVCLTLINKRKGVVEDSHVQAGYAVLTAAVPLANMFGFSTDLRSSTQGKGEYSMEYSEHKPVLPSVQEELVKSYQEKKAAAQTSK